MANVDPPVSQFGESQGFVEEAKLQSKNSSIEIHDRWDLVHIQNCPSELHCHMIVARRRRRSERPSELAVRRRTRYTRRSFQFDQPRKYKFGENCRHLGGYPGSVTG